MSYNVQAIQSLRNVDVSQRTPRQVRAMQNMAAMRTWKSQNQGWMMGFAGRYTAGLTLFNALPQAITSLANRPLQTAINYGPASVQKAILQGVGVKPGAGLARAVDEMVRGGVDAVTGGVSKFPALNWGSGLFFADAPSGALNVPENRPSYFGEQNPRAGGRPSSFQPRQSWNRGR